MKIIVSLIVVFLISFSLIFILVFKGNQKEPEQEKLNFFLVILVTFLIALFPTAAIALILFALFGSVSAVNMLFSLHISKNELIMLAIALIVYLFTIDNLIEVIVKHIIGKNILYFMIMLLIRILASYAIGKAIGINQTNSFMISSGVAFIILLIEVLYHLRERNVYNE
ncbi:hypothetical protein [Siminovitchia sp. 179-K 8D1 HS]|uniref:hypothetical protein n=1 Tax=Siminovitchia sp. 179-K 8D1 HS TaxID=3142385 RepID=UPI00399F4BF4